MEDRKTQIKLLALQSALKDAEPGQIGKAVKDVKAGKIDFKVDKFGIIHTSIGKVSFDSKMINENALKLLNFIQKLKPSSAKGIYVKSVSLSSTMSSSIKIDSSVLID